MKAKVIETQMCWIPSSLCQFQSLTWRMSHSLPLLSIATAYLFPTEAAVRGGCGCQMGSGSPGLVGISGTGRAQQLVLVAGRQGDFIQLLFCLLRLSSSGQGE